MEFLKLKSRYIPVYSVGFKINNELGWWAPNDIFQYHNVLFNLDTIEKEDISKLNFPSDMFFLADSGGFQTIRGTCNYDWKTSLIKQISLNVSKIFSFDIPPVRRKNEGQNEFVTFEENKVMEIIDKNIDIALLQSQWLKENNPEMLKRFCYIAQATSLKTLKYNFEKISEKVGKDNFSIYFPGGLVCSGKKEDIIFYAVVARYLKENFIDKGVYVHFLGIGSFQKMMIMIRNEITTFDSSNALRGAISWSFNNPIFPQNNIMFSKETVPFVKQSCMCPICSKYDYNEILKNNPELFGRIMVSHNLWYIISINLFLDSIEKTKFTDFIRKNIIVNEKTIKALEFCDECEKNGFECAYDKYKHFIKEDYIKQRSLF